MVAEGKMQMVWKQKQKKRSLPPKSFQFQTADEDEEEDVSAQERPATAVLNGEQPRASSSSVQSSNSKEAREALENFQRSEKFLNEGNLLAEEGKFGEALGKWESALYFTPGKAILHEQKAQVLLELGKSWSAVQAATCATELQPTWADAWVTLARAQLNYGEPSLAVNSAQTAVLLEPDHKEANAELERAQFLAIKQRHAVREAAALNLATEGLLSDNHSSLPSCRRARVYDSQDMSFSGEHHHMPDREPEPEEKSDKLDKYDDDTYDWVDELKRPAREITTDNLMSDFSDTI